MQPRSFILTINLHHAALFQPKGKELEQRALFSDAAWQYEEEFIPLVIQESVLAASALPQIPQLHSRRAREHCHSLQPRNLRRLLAISRCLNHSRYTDRPGRGNKRALLSRYALDKEGAAEDAVKDHFFKEVGSYLDKELKKGSFAHLYLFAEPQALGFLRKHSSKELLKSIIYSCHKDILPQTAEEILEKLKKEEILPKYTGSDSSIGSWQGGDSDSSTGASDSALEHGASEVEEFEAKPTAPEPILESRAV